MAAERILAIDPNPGPLRPALARLVASGYELHTATSIASAMDEIARWKPDAAIVSALARGIDVDALMCTLRAGGAELPVLAIAPPREGEEARLVAAGCDPYLTDAIDPEAVLARVRAFLDSGLSAESMAELRAEFCAMGANDCRTLLAGLPSAAPGRMLVPVTFDAGPVQKLLHQWAGVGATVGLPDVTAKAREAEALLKQPYGEISARLRELLESLLKVFSGTKTAVDHAIPDAAPAPVAGPRPADAPVVLVCEDDATLRRVIRMELQRHGITCKLTDNGRTAFAMARNIPPDAMILDVNLPGMDGFQVLQALRKLWSTRELPILLVTGRHAEADIFRGIDLGADAYIVKPFEPVELMGRLQSLLAVSR